MLAMLLAFALGVGTGFLLSFPAFAILWVVGLLVAAVAFAMSGMGFAAQIWQLVGFAVFAQVGFFVSALARVTFWPQSESPAMEVHEPLWNRLRRASKSRSAPRQQL